MFKLAVLDGIYPRLLMEVAEAISEALAISFENPWRTRGRGPSGLEMHIIQYISLNRRKRRAKESQTKELH